MVFKSIFHAIGNTPIVRLHSISEFLGAHIWAKLECFNPGQSSKDRAAWGMLEDAEQNGWLRPGGTVIESTSGNTGIGIAMIAKAKGYRCICVVPDKISEEKYNTLTALGAEVYVCPSSAKPQASNSYYSVAKRLQREIPGSYYVNQYYNKANLLSHYKYTGPEIWRQTEGRITHFIAAAGTGGTVSGVGRYLKERNPDIKIIAVDAYGSVLKTFFDTGLIDEGELAQHHTLMEGVGKGFIPDSLNVDYIDEFVKVHDFESAVQARSLAASEGILVGYSSGAVLQAAHQISYLFKPTDNVLLFFPDGGNRYISKIFNDNWMADKFKDKEFRQGHPTVFADEMAMEVSEV